jgi:hypothetical protein
MQYNTISQIQTRKYDAIGGKFFDSDMIASAYDAGKPHVFDKIMGQLFSSTDMFHGKPLLGMTMAKGKTVEIDTDVFRWKLTGAEEKFTRIVEVMDNNDAAGSTPGINRQTFRIKLDEAWYTYPDVIEGEHDDYHLEIVEGPVQDGNGYIYTVKLQTDNFSLFFPPELLAVGQEFCKVWTSVENEMNEYYGGINFSSTFELEQQIGAFADEFTVTDRMMREDSRMIGLPIPIRNDKGKVELVPKFITAAHAKLENRLYTDMEMQLWKGSKSTSVGPSGYFKRTGPGIREQLKQGHTMRYAGALTEAMLEDYLDGIFFSKVSHANRKITAMTGSMGAIAFHNLLATSASSFLTVDTNYIERTKDSGGARHLSYGAQFVHYQGLNGIEVDLVINPLYDDTSFCRRMHPDLKTKPLDSWRMTFLDFGEGNEGEDNITMLSEKSTRGWGYLEGAIDHMGKPKKGAAVTSKSKGCTYFTYGTAGIVQWDVSRGGELILDPEA